MNRVQTELEGQFAGKLTRKISTAQLRVLRAWYADLIENDRTTLKEVVALRGSIVDQEIQRRESNGDWSALKRFWYSGDQGNVRALMRVRRGKQPLDNAMPTFDDDETQD